MCISSIKSRNNNGINNDKDNNNYNKSHGKISLYTLIQGAVMDRVRGQWFKLFGVQGHIAWACL